jgi:hypothetical protein
MYNCILLLWLAVLGAGAFFSVRYVCRMGRKR